MNEQVQDGVIDMDGAVLSSDSEISEREPGVSPINIHCMLQLNHLQFMKAWSTRLALHRRSTNEDGWMTKSYVTAT